MKNNATQTRIALVLCCTFSCLAISASAQGTIYSTLSDRNTGIHGFSGNRALLTAAWSQSDTFSDVSIAAKLDGANGTVSGTAYLTTRIGPGTTTADEIARHDYSISSPVFQPELETLFSGLTLRPGTYYLVLSGSATALGGGWEVTSQIFPTMAPGVEVAYRDGNSYYPFAAYPPATQFPAETASDFSDQYLQFSVSVVPEPGTAALAFLGTVLLGISLRRNVRRKFSRAAAADNDNPQ